ncbi:hypothetical protein [Singulisphaera sp. GP187]|uniref:hypothetical protein n=1 Tax=Singulisphaera sp. GP187 TaxID=1882752 RepID=UPI0011614E57|nr:hypothetical protein [Singulisphaera sp. GP187]
MSTRRGMVVVAAVGLACAATVVVMERKERFARIARQHSGVFPPLSFVDLIVASEPDRERLMLWGKRVGVWHSEMAKKYQYAARYPWLRVEPDPPEPSRPGRATRHLPALAPHFGG